MEKQNYIQAKERIHFHGGLFSAFIPLFIFCLGVLGLCVIWHGVDFVAMATIAFVGLLVGGMLCKEYDLYWEAVAKAIASPTSVSVLVILFVVGMFGALIKACNVSSGFVWLAHSVNLSGGGFAVFVFLSTCIISTATGSSFAALFTGFPIFYPCGVLLGCRPGIMAGLILAGAIFGDNLAPISDTTILSAGSQEYKNKAGTADVGGCVATRFKYSIVGAAIASVIYFLIAGGNILGEGAEEILALQMNPNSLIMLIPVAVALAVSVKTRNIYKAMTVGLILGTIVALASGLLAPADIFCVVDGAPGGFLFSGVNGMLGVVILIISLYGIIGVLEYAGAFQTVIDAMLGSNLAKSPRGGEIMLAASMTLLTSIMGGAQDPAILTMGPIYNRVGQELNLHPYRRANLLDGFSNSLPVSIPFLSCYIFLTSQLTTGYDFVAPLSVMEIATGMIYPICLFVILITSILTGWGRTFEGPNGEVMDANGHEIKRLYSILH